MFAAPHGLSQRTTSFIACACQGIHRTPLFHLIALITNARPFQDPCESERETNGASIDAGFQRKAGSTHPVKVTEQVSAHIASIGNADFRKTSVTRELPVGRGGQASVSMRSSHRQRRNVRTTLLFTMSANRQPTRVKAGWLQISYFLDKPLSQLAAPSPM